MSIHVHLYREQSAVTLIQRVQHSKNRFGAETIAELLQTHRSWNALPDRNRVQCERFNPLTWVRKKIRTTNALQMHCKRSMCETGVTPGTHCLRGGRGAGLLRNCCGKICFTSIVAGPRLRCGWTAHLIRAYSAGSVAALIC